MARISYSEMVTTRPGPFRVEEFAGRTWIVDATGDGIAAFSGDDAIRNANAFVAMAAAGTASARDIEEAVMEEREEARQRERDLQDELDEARDEYLKAVQERDDARRALSQIESAIDEAPDVVAVQHEELLGKLRSLASKAA